MFFQTFVDNHKCRVDRSLVRPRQAGLPDKCAKTQHTKAFAAIIHYSRNRRAESRRPVQKVPPHTVSVTVLRPHTGTLHKVGSGGGVMCSLESISVLSGCPVTREAIAPLLSLSAHLSHLITLRLCLSVLVSLATCLQQWTELWPQHGRSMVPWRGKKQGRGR